MILELSETYIQHHVDHNKVEIIIGTKITKIKGNQMQWEVGALVWIAVNVVNLLLWHHYELYYTKCGVEAGDSETS